MKYFKFDTYEVGCGAECLSGSCIRYSRGNTLKEAKSKLVKQVGCTEDYFDDPRYTTITEISKEEYQRLTQI